METSPRNTAERPDTNSTEIAPLENNLVAPESSSTQSPEVAREVAQTHARLAEHRPTSAAHEHTAHAGHGHEESHGDHGHGHGGGKLVSFFAFFSLLLHWGKDAVKDAASSSGGGGGGGHAPKKASGGGHGGGHH